MVEEFNAIRGGSNEEDLCWLKQNADFRWPPFNSGVVNANGGIESCDGTACAWEYINPNCTSPIGQYSGCNRQVASFLGATRICSYYG